MSVQALNNKYCNVNVMIKVHTVASHDMMR